MGEAAVAAVVGGRMAVVVVAVEAQAGQLLVGIEDNQWWL